MRTVKYLFAGAVLGGLAMLFVVLPAWDTYFVPERESAEDGILRAYVYLTLWFPAGTILGGIIGGLLSLRSPKPRRDHCRKCGYDLRGSTHRSTCPECGELIQRG